MPMKPADGVMQTDGTTRSCYEAWIEEAAVLTGAHVPDAMDSGAGSGRHSQ